MNQQQTLEVCLRNFLYTKEIHGILCWWWLLVINWGTPKISAACFCLGCIIYYYVEALMHKSMHVLPNSPFHHSHQRHHNNPLPETGVPDWWVFVMYYGLTWFFWYFDAKVMLGLWFGILTMLITYEWFHFLHHCNYRPKTKYGWHIRIHHLMHHNFDSSKNYELLFVPKKKEYHEQ